MRVQPAWQVPRNGLLWLLIAFVAVIAPHIPHLPVWVTIAAAVAVIWRIQVYRGCWGFPGIWIKIILSLLCLGGVLLSYGLLAGLEPMVALLVSGYCLKLLEMHRPRDALVLVFLGYFIVVSLCLFEQSLLMSAYVLLSLLLVTAALIGLQQTGELPSATLPGRVAFAIVLQALPLMLVLFLVMPRFGPLWSVPTRGDSATTGISDSMSPGDFTRLGRSSETAFRVSFDGYPPARNKLYWRGLVFSDFDGRTWRQAVSWGYGGEMVRWFDRAYEARQQRKNWSDLDYSLMLEPTYQQWLYALTPSEPLSDGVGLNRDYSLVYRTPVTGKLEYRARFKPRARRDNRGLPALRRLIETRLPADFNPETRRIAQEWLSEAADTEALIQRLLAHYHARFTYTLEPPPLGRHSVDEFLWYKQRGFCEHFAGSFVFFLRAAGIPARVVVGYQGGEYNAGQNYLTVRQYDAHAWAEVWLPERGWVEFDPTGAVAPERISIGLAGALSQDETFLADEPFSLQRYRAIPWLNLLRLQLDYLDYLWGRWVVRYEGVQDGVLARLLGSVDPLRIGLFIVVAGCLSLLPVVLVLWWRRPRQERTPLDQLYLDFCRKLAQAGMARRPGEGPRDFAERAAAGFPDCREQIQDFSRSFEESRYGVGTGEPTKLRLKQLRLQLHRLRPRPGPGQSQRLAGGRVWRRRRPD